MIRLETSKRTGIRNDQGTDIKWGALEYLKKIAAGRPNVKTRTGPSPLFNCHGLTFGSRRTKITETADLFRILRDDCWEEIKPEQTMGGDVVLYLDGEGDVNHSGIVVWREQDLGVPWICSKWGFAGEFLHMLGDVPDWYGPTHKFYRCKL